MALVSMAFAVAYLIFSRFHIDRHFYFALVIIFMDVLAVLLHRKRQYLGGIYLLFFSHSLIFIIPIFLGFGRISDLMAFPVIMCWAAMIVKRRSHLLAYMFILATTCGTSVYMLRFRYASHPIDKSLVGDSIVSLAILVIVYLSIRSFYKGLYNHKRLNDEKKETLTIKNARLKEHIDTNLQLESFAQSASSALKKPVAEVTDIANDFYEKSAHKLTDNELEYLNFIRGQAKQMDQLTSDLLELTTLSDDQSNKRSINPHQLVERLVSEQYDHMRDRIIIRSLPDQISANPMQIHTLLKNIIDNAIKYAHPDRPARVEISTTSSRDYHTISVMDNGRGISDEHKQNAFLIFKRLQSGGEGTGIGLATCKRIVEKHGGTVTLKDNPDGGLIFQFSLPT